MTKGRVDLHVHSDYCDGASVEEIVEEAHKRNIVAVAVTDHQEVRGIDAVIDTAEKAGVELEVIPAIELTTLDGFDILGYFIDHHDAMLFGRLMQIQKGRRKRATGTAGKLQAFFKENKVGIEISIDAVLRTARNGNIAGGHFEKFIYEEIKKAFVDDTGRYTQIMNALIDAINKACRTNLTFDDEMKITTDYGVKFVKEGLIRDHLLHRGCPGYEERTESDCFRAQEAIELIKMVKGVPAIAHPGDTSNDGMLPTIIRMGVEGLEVFSSKHTPEQNKAYARLCMDCGLLMTAGSDWHGREFTPYIDLGEVGSAIAGSAEQEVYRPDYSMVERLRERKEKMYGS